MLGAYKIYLPRNEEDDDGQIHFFWRQLKDFSTFAKY